MEKIKFFSVLILICITALNLKAQIKISTNGNVAVGSISNQLTKLDINGSTYLPYNNSYWIGSANDAGNRLRMHHNGSNAYIDFYPNLYFRGSSANPWIFSISGVDPCIYSSSNWGVLGKSDAPLYWIYSNHINCNGIELTSDERLKSNIKNFQGCLKKIKLIKGVTYDLDPELKNSKEFISNKNKTSIIDDTISLNQTERRINQRKDKVKSENKNKIGFLAQDLKLIFPELVHQDSITGFYSVDYLGMIPVLTNAFNELQSQIDVKDSVITNTRDQIIFLQKILVSQEQNMIALENEINNIKKNCCNTLSKNKSANISESDNVINSNIDDPKLYQNSPNPFTQNTEIKYFIPEKTVSSLLYIFNAQGIIIEKFNIINHGNGSTIINGSMLKAGLYLYSLIIDGKEIDTKRMILTQ